MKAVSMFLILLLTLLMPIDAGTCPTSPRRYSHLMATHTQYTRDYLLEDACLDSQDRLTLAFTVSEATSSFPALAVLDPAGAV